MTQPTTQRQPYIIPPIFEGIARHPKALLLLLTTVEMLMFFDRGAIASVLPFVKSHWELSGKQEGIIGSAFIITFSIGSAIFAYMANFVRVNLIMSFGLFVWTASAILSGLWGTLSHGVDQQWGYYLLVISRALIGIGEASFVPLSVTLIDDIATKEYKTTYMSFFMLGVPLGVAFGYSISPLIVGLGSWTYCFYIEAIFGLFFGCLLLFVPLSAVKTNQAKKTDEVTEPVDSSNNLEKENADLNDEKHDTSDEVTIVNISKLEHEKQDHHHLSDDEDQGADSNDALLDRDDDSVDEDIIVNEPMIEEELAFTHEQRKQQHANQKKNRYQIFSFFSALKYLFCNPVYCFATLGSCGYSFCIGAIQFYAPTYVFHKMKQVDSSITVSSDSANIGTVGFSMAMLIASIIGTMSGGFIVDKFGGSNGMKGAARGLLFCTIFLILGFPWVIPCFIFTVNIYVLLILFGISCCFLFCSTSPFQCSVVNSVEHKNLRNYAVSWQILLYHLLGDFPSPFLFGLLQDSFSIDVAMGFVWMILIPSAFVFLLGYFVSQYWLYHRHEALKKHYTTTVNQDVNLEEQGEGEEENEVATTLSEEEDIKSK